MSFVQAVQAVLKNYAGFTGRARRSEYWFFVLFNILVSVVLGILAALIRTNAVGYIVSLALLIPGIAVTIRRLHDTNRSGWWLLIALVPLVGVIVLIVFCATEGHAGQNQYGPDPKAAPAQTTVVA